jgi:hypothetical protein
MTEIPAPRPPLAESADDAAAQRVAACALGLAFAGRLDDAAVAEILDMAEGDRRLVSRAHTAVGTLGVVDAGVADHARGLLLRATDAGGRVALEATKR